MFLKKYSLFLFVLAIALIPIFTQPAFSAQNITLHTLELNKIFLLLASLIIIKPAYLLLFVILLFLFHQQKNKITSALFWGGTALLLGELTCGTVYAAFGNELVISEYIHSYGIAVEFSFFFFAFVEVLTQRRSAWTQFIFLFTILFGCAASFYLMTVSIIPSGYHADIFGYPYTYIRFEFNQWVESRVFPLMALICFLSSLFLFKKENAVAKVLLSSGAGLTVLCLFRTTMGVLFTENLFWFEFSEEITQLILSSTILFLLWKFKPIG